MKGAKYIGTELEHIDTSMVQVEAANQGALRHTQKGQW